jgi:hypothetical protein
MAVAGAPAPSEQLTPSGMQLFAAQAAGGGGTYTGAQTVNPNYNSAAAQQMIPAPYTQPAPAAPRPPQMPNFMTPAMSQYVNQFKASQEAQQQAINAGLLNAMQGLGERRDAASSTVAATQPQLAASLGSEQAAQAHTQSMGAGLPPAAAPTVDGQTLSNVVAAGAKETAAANKSSGAAMNAGVAADYTKGKTTLSNQQMQNIAQVQQQQQQFDQQMVAMKAQAEQQWAQQQASFTHDKDMATLQANLQHPGGQLTPQQQIDMQNQQQLMQGQNDAAIKAGYTSYAQQQQYVHDPRLAFAQSAINGRFANGGEYTPGIKSLPAKGNVQQAFQYLIGFNDPLLIQAALAQGWNPDEYKKAQKAGALTGG